VKTNGGFNSGKIKFWRPVSGQKRRDWRKLSDEERKKLEGTPFKERVKAFFKRADRTKLIAVLSSALVLLIVAGVVLSLALGGGGGGGNNNNGGNENSGGGENGSAKEEYDRLFEFSLHDGAYELTAVKRGYTTYIIPEEYDYVPVKSIAMGAFKDGDFIEILSVPTGVKELGFGVLKDLKNLKELTLPFVGASADADADWDAESNSYARFCYIFGDSNSSITDALTKLTVNGNIPKNAFKDATRRAENHIETIKIGTRVKTINESAFADCPRLREIFGGENLENINAYAFSDCPFLKEITLESRKLTSVEPSAFGENLSALTFSAYSEDEAKEENWYINLIEKCPDLEKIIKYKA
jgi:hypothetical protein